VCCNETLSFNINVLHHIVGVELSSTKRVIRRPVAPVRPARRAPSPKTPRANSPYGRKPNTWRSRPRGNARRRRLSDVSMPPALGLKARTHKAAGGRAYGDVAPSARPKLMCSMSSPPPRSTSCGLRRGWRGRLGPQHDSHPLRHWQSRRLGERLM